jgi:hypothetical protein
MIAMATKHRWLNQLSNNNPGVPIYPNSIVGGWQKAGMLHHSSTKTTGCGSPFQPWLYPATATVENISC